MTIPVRIDCACGQPYSFDVEPVDGRFDGTVQCPSCGVDGTAATNEIVQAALLKAAAKPSLGGLRVSSHAHTPPPAASAAPAPAPSVPPAEAPARRPFPAAAAPAARSDASGEFNWPGGILGAFLGAGVGAGIVIAVAQTAGFVIPLPGLLIGAVTGYGARLMFRGTDGKLGILSACVAVAAVAVALLVARGGFSVFNLISVFVGASFAHKIASA